MRVATACRFLFSVMRFDPRLSNHVLDRLGNLRVHGHIRSYPCPLHSRHGLLTYRPIGHFDG